MSRFKRTEQAQEESMSIWSPTLPIDENWGIYARQSTQAQLIKNVQSTEMQTEELIDWLISRGVNKDNVSLFDADLGVSGTKRIDERTGLQQLVEQIKSGKIKAVLIYQVSRLFRDETGVQYNVFADICKKKNCILVTADGMIFNFNNPMHMKMFRYLSEMAAEYIPQHIHMLHQMRERKARKGLYAGLGSIARGYIVDYNKHSSTHQKYIPYKPHAEVVLGLFRRFYEMGADLPRLCRELEALPVVFPPFDATVDQRTIAMTHLKEVPGGYHITRKGLISMFTNPIYIGWWIVRGDIVSRDNHERIISEEDEHLFWYAFSRLSEHTIDGEVNEQKVTGTRKFYHKNTTPTGILKDRITSPNGGVYVHISEGVSSYCTVPPESRLYKASSSEIEVDLVDKAFYERFFYHLRSSHDFDNYQKYLAEMEEQHASTVSSLSTQLLEVEHQQKEISEEILATRRDITQQTAEAMYTNPSLDHDAVKQQFEQESAPYLRDLRKKFSDLEVAKVEMQKKLSNQKEPTGIQDMRRYADFHTELEELINVWDEKDFQDRRDFVNLFVKEAVLTVAATHWVQLELQWTMPGWAHEVLFLFRRRGDRSEWTDEERDILREHYRKTNREIILQALPEKSWNGIKKEAIKLGLRRKSHQSIPLSEFLTWNDWQFMQEAEIELEDRSTKCVPLSAPPPEFSVWHLLANQLAMLLTKAS